MKQPSRPSVVGAPGKNVALSGRLYVQADPSNGAVNPCDLLIPSSTPGHAMKVTDHAKASGAILGKAMTGLNEGQGLVLVLVNVQYETSARKEHRRDGNKSLTRAWGLWAALQFMCLLVPSEPLMAQTDQMHPFDRKYFSRSPLGPEEYMKAVSAITNLQTAKGRHPLSAAVTPCGPWVAIGPFGDIQASIAVQGQVNGRISAVQTWPDAGGYYLYVGGSSGGIWRRHVPGTAWTSLGDNLPNPSVGAFVVDPGNSDNILVGTGDDSRYTGAGMFHTTDGGGMWKPVALPVTPYTFFRIFYPDPNNLTWIEAASDAGLLQTTSGPDGPWKVSLSGRITDLVIHPKDPKIQYCCRCSSGVYSTTNGGAGWDLISRDTVPSSDFGDARIALCRDAPDTLVFCYGQDHVKGVRQSSNRGVKWTDITFGTTFWDGGSIANDLALAIRPNNPHEIYIGVGDAWVLNTSNGTKWNSLSQLNQSSGQDGHHDHHQLYFSPDSGDNLLWLCNDGGVYRYSIGGSTVSWNGDPTTGLSVGQVNHEGLDASRNIRLVGLQDVGVAGSTDLGVKWDSFSCCDGGGLVITDDINPTFWFVVGTPYQSITMQPFGGAAQDISPPPNFPYYELFYDQFAGRVFTIGGDSSATFLYSHAADGSGDWAVELKLPNGQNPPFFKLAGSHLVRETLYLTRLATNCTITVLKKSGSTWQQTTSPIKPPDSDLERIVVSNQRIGESWALFSNKPQAGKILHTRDDWNTWEDISGNLTNLNLGSMETLAVSPINPNVLFLGTDLGVFESEDAGESWSSFQNGLPIVSVTGLRYVIDATHSAGSDKLVAATFGRGVYERCLSASPLVYVDPRAAGVENGTFEHPYNTLDKGLTNTPSGGAMALNGQTTYAVPRTLNKPMSIYSYAGAASFR